MACRTPACPAGQGIYGVLGVLAWNMISGGTRNRSRRGLDCPKGGRYNVGKLIVGSRIAGGAALHSL